jgi:wobble nucleotide-excising tRNase
LNYSFNILRAMVDGACQVFLLTHNLHFMNEVRKWLFRLTPSGLERAKKDAAGATAALLLLDVVQPGGSETRACALRELPKHIRDYESEYHYLLHLIFKFVATPESTEYFFLMPNAMRKVLDVFLAFKVPGPAGLGSKVEKLVREVEGIDPARVHALVTLAQVESHSDNLDDLITFSSATVEEVREAAQTLIDVLKRMDEAHLNDMKKLCA